MLLNNLHVNLIDMKARTVLCVRHIGPYQRIGAAFTTLERELLSRGIEAEAMLAIYHDNPEHVEQEALRSDAAAQVSDTFPVADSGLTLYTIPSGRFARWTHKGPYDQLQGSWQAGYKAMVEMGLDARGVCYEEYLNDPCNTEPDALMTAIYQQIG